MARSKRTPKRDTIVELSDFKTGYQARLKIPAQTLHIAQSSPISVMDRRQIHRAQATICIQAKKQMMKAGRSGSWLKWEDIASSIVELAHLNEAVPVRTKPLQGQLFSDS